MLRRAPAVLLGLLLLSAAPPPTLRAQVPAAEESLRDRMLREAVVEEKVMVPMRDGVRLAADVFRPRGEGPFPIVFSRTPYNFNAWRDGEFVERAWASAWEAVSRGYAYVVMNERGRFFSEGTWDILGPPLTDAWDVFQWMQDQPWSSGRIVTVGCSSTAEWQMAAASLDHPAHTALVAQGFGAGVGRIGDWYEQGNWYRGGAEQMLFFAWLYGVQHLQRPTFPPDLDPDDRARLSRYWDLAPEMPRVDWARALEHLPLVDIMENVQGPEGIYREMIQRTPDDPAWYEGGLYHDDMPFDKPALWLMSWYDVSTGPNLALFNHVRENARSREARDNQYAVIAPTLHCAYTRATENTVVGERSVGDARWDYEALLWAWHDHWLRGEDNGLVDTLPRVRYFTMGANEWNAADAWPPPEAETRTWWLDSGGAANSLDGDGRLVEAAPDQDRPDTFVYDPMDPVRSYGGNVCCTGNAIDGGAFDQRPAEQRDDVLVYTTEPFPDGLEVTGTVEVTLYLSSDVPDTDLTVKLLDVYPDGRAYNLDETIQRVRWREGYEGEPAFMEPGEVYEVRLSPMSTSNFFAPGHRLRVEVSSSNFPRFTRNLNTGGPNWNETEGVPATNTIHHSARWPSRVEVSVMPR